jgi:hypothetical protein
MVKMHNSLRTCVCASVAHSETLDQCGTRDPTWCWLLGVGALPPGCHSVGTKTKNAEYRDLSGVCAIKTNTNVWRLLWQCMVCHSASTLPEGVALRPHLRRRQHNNRRRQISRVRWHFTLSSPSPFSPSLYPAYPMVSFSLYHPNPVGVEPIVSGVGSPPDDASVYSRAVVISILATLTATAVALASSYAVFNASFLDPSPSARGGDNLSGHFLWRRFLPFTAHVTFAALAVVVSAAVWVCLFRFSRQQPCDISLDWWQHRWQNLHAALEVELAPTTRLPAPDCTSSLLRRSNIPATPAIESLLHGRPSFHDVLKHEAAVREGREELFVCVCGPTALGEAVNGAAKKLSNVLVHIENVQW